MTDGGVTEEEAGGVREAAGAAGGTGRFSWLRGHPWLAGAVALAVVAGGVAVPLALGGGGGPSCKELPASTRALARDPAAATRALDPRDDMSRFTAVRALLPTGRLCGDGGRVLGEVVDAATGTTGAGTTVAGRAHTMAQARALYAVVVLYREDEVPSGAEPGLARMLAGYIVDTTRPAFSGDGSNTPAASARSAVPDETGWSRFGAFLSPADAHPDFGFDQSGGLSVYVGPLFDGLAKDPEAFAILYDAERAYLAHYLERLTDRGTVPGYHPGKGPKGQRTSDTSSADADLDDIARRVGGLMRVRTSGVRDGDTDLAAYDRSVRRHTRGAYRAAPARVTTRPPMGGIAGRPVSGPVRGDLLDGREQLFQELDAWAKTRKVPAARLSAMRQILDDGYVQAFRVGSL
ncbi:hypothetical protein [Streptomyces sp. NPDC048106]|uniref:hypothetical protein n=1 Tax=Streptomyces sp. NPDC048106 TaxID=3155750 RepID=UPI00345641DA